MVHVIDRGLFQRARPVGAGVVDEVTDRIAGRHFPGHRGSRRGIAQTPRVESNPVMPDSRRTPLQRYHGQPLVEQILRNRLPDTGTRSGDYRHAFHHVFSGLPVNRLIIVCGMHMTARPATRYDAPVMTVAASSVSPHASSPAPAWSLVVLIVIGLIVDQHVAVWGQH